jgi:HK97 family phage major capsid protein
MDILEELKAELKSIKEGYNKIPDITTRLDDIEKAFKRPPLPQVDGTPEVSKTKAFVNFLRYGKADMKPDERKQLVEDSDGRVLVPDEVDSELRRRLPELNVVRNLATVRQTSREVVNFKFIDEVKGGFGEKLETSNRLETALGDSLNEKKKWEIENKQLYVEDLNGLVRVGVDLLSDSMFDLEAYVRDSFTRKRAEAEEEAFILGRGHSKNEPLGLFDYDDAHEDAVESDKLSAKAILDLIYSVPSQYRRNGAFIMDNRTEAEIMKLAHEEDFVFIQNTNAALPNMLFGYPIYTTHVTLSPYQVGTVKDQRKDALREDLKRLKDLLSVKKAFYPIAFGDFKSAYVVLDRLGTTVQRLNELYIESGQIGFKFSARVGGGVINHDAYCLLKLHNVEAAQASKAK